MPYRIVAFGGIDVALPALHSGGIRLGGFHRTRMRLGEDFLVRIIPPAGAMSGTQVTVGGFDGAGIQ